MRLPNYLRVRRQRQVGRTVEVELAVDVSGFVDAMLKSAEDVSIARYRLNVAHQRSLGQAYVGTRLDKLCADLGLDPVEAWRFPKWLDEQARRDRSMINAALRAGFMVQAPQQITWSDGVA